MTKKEVFEMLEKLNIAKVIVEFSGGGDEGGADSISAYNENNEVVELPKFGKQRVSRFDHTQEKWVYDRELTETEKMLEALEKPIEDKYGGFDGDFYVSGEVVWDVKKKKVLLSGKESVQHEESFDDEEIEDE